jgi:hypothetical protein
VLAVVVSPRINPSVQETPLGKADSDAFLRINDAHYKPIDQIMILLSQYGREVVWTLTAILLFIFGGWTGRKCAVVIAIAMIVLIPLGIIAKVTIGRVRPAIPDTDFLMSADKE